MGPGQEMEASTGGRNAALRVAAISGGEGQEGRESPEECAVPGRQDRAAGAISTG